MYVSAIIAYQMDESSMKPYHTYQLNDFSLSLIANIGLYNIFIIMRKFEIERVLKIFDKALREVLEAEDLKNCCFVSKNNIQDCS